MPKKPTVSVVIVNYNGKALLKALLESLKKSNFKGYEIIIVDNNSTDGSREFIKKNYKNAELVVNKENLGYTGINSSLGRCSGKYILFLNNDMAIDRNCISRLVKTMQSNKDAAMAAPKLVNYYDRTMQSGGTWLSRAFYSGHVQGSGKNVIGEIPYLGVGLIRKDFADMFGYLLDPDYFIYSEDVDLGLRIRLSGKKILFDPYAVLYHMHAVTAKKASKAFTTYLMERNSLTTFFKILSLKNILLFLPYAFGMRLFAILKDILMLNIPNAFARIRAMGWIIFNGAKVHKKRKEAQKFRKASDSYIFRVFSEKYLLKRKFLV